MIRYFSVQNYLSIRDKQELSFLAKPSDSPLVSEMPDGTFLYKLGVFYGSNASGKSNILWALNKVFGLLVAPNTDTQDKVPGYIPFILTKDKPSEMSVSFYAAGIRYDYSIVFDGVRILNEELVYYPNKVKALFYERKFVDDHVQPDVKFGASLQLQPKTQDAIRTNILNNHSVLSVCKKNSFKEDVLPFTRLHTWVMEHYHEVDGDDTDDKSPTDILKEARSNSRMYKFYVTMLNKADLNIVDFKPIVQDRYIPNVLRKALQRNDVPENIKKELLAPTTDSIAFLNRSEQEVFEVPLKWQSKGTLKYIKIFNPLYDLISGQHVYYLDELGEDLHYDLLFYYLSVFLFNSEQSQLLITSQETALLQQDLLNENRGAVWFVDKNRETASSEYNRADSFGLHKNLSLYNSYRIGRMGAKPELGSIFLDLDD